MKLTIALEARFIKTPDQKIWSETVFTCSFWYRYLDVFDSLEVIARVQDVDNIPPGYKRANGERVMFTALPAYIGPYQYLCNTLAIDKIVHNAVENAEAVILRIPGQVSNCLFRHLKKNKHLYGVEVVGDPYDVFAPGSVNHLFRRFFRWWGVRQLKKQCKKAVSASYVTELTLQKRYPCDSVSVGISDVEICSEVICLPKVYFGIDKIFTLILVGSLAQMYKAPDILINAIALCVARGHKISLKIIGDGKFRSQLEQQVARLGLNDSISFLGQLPAGEAVRNELLQSDLFILPSRTEGLPRAMIEAMACGLPCIGSNVGGIPELLPSDDLVPPGDVQALADKIEEIITDPERMCSMSKQNLKKAMEFRNDILDQRRQEFYNCLRQKTETWLQEKKAK